MHEMRIASSLLEQVIEFARQNNAEGVGQIELETGAIRQVIPDPLQ